MADIQSLNPCPFCKSTDVDPKGWMNGRGQTGPACNDCGGSAETIELWQAATTTRVCVPDEWRNAMQRVLDWFDLCNEEGDLVCPKEEYAQIKKLLAAKPATPDGLISFALACLAASRAGSGLDGADIQELALEHGLIESYQATEPCDPEGCPCSEVGGFPIECYRNSTVLTASTQKEESSPEIPDKEESLLRQPVRGNLRVMGNIELLEDGDVQAHDMALVITFDNTDDIRTAIQAGVCEFGFMDQEQGE